MKAAKCIIYKIFKRIEIKQTFLAFQQVVVNAFFDELNDISEITPIVTKHEGAASYMAAAYAKYTNQLSVCVGCSGPGGTNYVTGAANAMRDTYRCLTGAVHTVNTMGLNASRIRC